MPEQSQQAGTEQLTARMAELDAENADLLADIDAGVSRDQSIGFRASDRIAIKGPDDQVQGYRLHAPGEGSRC